MQLTQKELEFDSAFKNRGGICSDMKFEYMLQNMRNIISFLRSSRPGLPEVNLNLINNLELGASAVSVSDKFYIGINVGTYIVLTSLFGRMLAHPDVLIDCGNVSVEIKNEKLYNAHIVDASIAVIVSEKPLFPKDKTRIALSVYLVDIAMCIILIHEFAHVINGHCGYLNSLLGNHNLSEIVNVSSDRKLENKLNQTLEFDADCYSTLKGLFISVYNFENNNIHPLLFDYIKDSKDVISMFSFANYSLWRLFGLNEYNYDELFNYSHPLPSIRQFIALQMICTIHENDTSIDSIVNKAINSTLESEKAFSLISEINNDKVGLKFAMSKTGANHISELKANFQEIKHLLQPFAFNGLV